MTRRKLLFAPAALAEAGPLDAFAPLIGEWEGSGTFAGRPATARYEIGFVLGGRFARLTYAVTDAAGKPVFEGHGYYKAGGAGTWQDSQGNLYPVVWSAGAGFTGVAASWNSGAGASEYRREGDELAVSDRMGERPPFARFRLKRTSA